MTARTDVVSEILDSVESFIARTGYGVRLVMIPEWRKREVLKAVNSVGHYWVNTYLAGNYIGGIEFKFWDRDYIELSH